jgi:hypothetical protein
MAEVLSVQGARQIAPTPMRLVLERSRDLDFPLLPIGRSRAPVLPQLVGEWWMEPLTTETYLPPRAEARLQQVRQVGIAPKAIVVFHELTGQTQPSPLTRTGQRLGRFASVDVPAAAMRAGHLAQQHGPGVLRAAAVSAGVVLTGIGLIALATVTAAVSVTDPCLVIVTEDGYWLEIDRWYS